MVSVEVVLLNGISDPVLAEAITVKNIGSRSNMLEYEKEMFNTAPPCAVGTKC